MFRQAFFRLSRSNANEAIPNLLSMSDSNNQSQLIPLLAKAAKIRPFALPQYAEFAINAINDENVKQELLQELLDPDTEYPGSIILSYLLWKKNLFSASQITDYLAQKYENFSGYKARYVFVIFSVLIKERNRDAFEEKCRNFYMTYAIGGAGNIFASFFQNLPSKSESEIKEIILSPYGEIGNAIVNDNVEFLRNSEFNVNNTLVPSFYVATDLGQQSPTYLQWACICGAEKCVQYLLEHGSDPNKNDREGRSALQYAAAGGNLTILKEIQKLVGDMDRAKEMAIEYENRDVFDQI
ncbi:hypothetical protein TRFO_14789 [Tritrichomonas foetus]|uniref:Uncharacterized protein n=1 Tax=Tritrichomonas foetus TaxID=1144522 RepID=A0A1J4KU89_9EUKA|nr:hypothetical protein TRFO_14789 [Tritrichomonas foetus]|eukprot:OHT14835.1 hypothetical protein TRFO_14789 [Tritrichomonas foetus]